jgi:glutamate synthase (NADPH/NADH) small chain
MENFKEKATLLSKDAAFHEADRCLSCPKPRCREFGCPAEIDIPSFIKCLKARDIDGAYRIIMEYSNLSPICSRVCDYEKQCIGNCILNFKKQPIPVGHLERFVQDNKTIELTPCAHFSDHHVAIIGSGPAGISCALELVKNGVHATVYEKEKHPGGLLTYGIPEYRLPKLEVERYIAFTRRMGVEYKMEQNVSLAELKKSYDKVFIGCGLSVYKSLHIPGEEGQGVFQAGSFLKAINEKVAYEEGEGISLKGITYVVGAGNVAMDCCRTSVRLGAEKTYIVYRRTIEEAPASKDEIKDAQDEGVIFNFLHNPVEVLLKDGHVSAIKCEVMKLGEPDESGRKRPEGTGVYETYPCDNLILAIGQGPDTAFTESLGLETNHGYIVSSDGISTSDPNVYAGGDVVRGADTVVRSMVDGKKAAQKILADFAK